MVQHRQLNLLQDFAHLGTFDVIFCRNVLIYFDQDTKTGVFERLAKVTESDGFMVLGAAESVVGISDAFKPIRNGAGFIGRTPSERRSLVSRRPWHSLRRRWQWPRDSAGWSGETG